MTEGARTPGRERQEKILRAIYEVAGGTRRLCPYEDVVVLAWKMWPQEFGLRGHIDKYPDASDLHKPLYGPMKRDGLVRAQAKKFGLTERGLAVAESLAGFPSGTDPDRGRVERHQKAELLRVADRAAVRMVLSEQPEELLDTDLYDFYGVTVRTSPADFAGRVTTVDDSIDAALDSRDPSLDPRRVAAVAATRDELRRQFGQLLSERSAAGKRRTTKGGAG